MCGADLIVTTPKISISKPSDGSVHLDALRGAAALIVFANHTRALYFPSALQESSPTALTTHPSAVQATAPTETFGEIKFASEAVVIFFVLSGYLVGGSVLRSLRTAQWSWRVYLTKRITRLYVVLIPAILIGVGLDYAGIHLFGPASIYTAPEGMGLGSLAGLIGRLQPSVMLGNALFLESIRVPFPGTNASIWSLVNEFWYYLAFPLLALAWTAKRSWLLRLGYILAACALLTFVGWHIAILFPIWIFGALASMLPRRFSMKQAKQLSAVFSILLLTGMIGVRLLRLQAVPADYLIGVLTALLLWAVVQQTTPAREGLYKTVTGFFSRISYTLYLFHLPMAMFVSGLLNSPWRRWTYTPKNVAIYLGSDMVLLLCVYGLWWTFEAKTDRIRAWIFERERPVRNTGVA
jgi:peptidoglycan/LPS O-acetylase OafA/YrhL